MTHHFNEPLWQQVRKERMARRGLIKEDAMSEWRTIDSAPKDGTYVLLITAGNTDHQIGFWSKSGQCWDDGDFQSHMTGFTHWMPLPQPPQG